MICFGSLSFIQWKRSASLSSSLMCTFRKGCSMSPYSATGKNLFLASTLQRGFCNAGPVSKHSFNEGLEQFDSAEALFSLFSHCPHFRTFYVFSDNRFIWNIIFFTIWLPCYPLDDSFCELLFDDVVFLFKFLGVLLQFSQETV